MLYKYITQSYQLFIKWLISIYRHGTCVCHKMVMCLYIYIYIYIWTKHRWFHLLPHLKTAYAIRFVASLYYRCHVFASLSPDDVKQQQAEVRNWREEIDLEKRSPPGLDSRPTRMRYCSDQADHWAPPHLLSLLLNKKKWKIHIAFYSQPTVTLMLWDAYTNVRFLIIS